MRVTRHHPSFERRPPADARFSATLLSGGRSATVRVRGEIDAASSGLLGDALLEAGDRHRDVRLDLAETTFIDSAGIRVLVRSMWDLRDRDSVLHLVAASPTAETTLRTTGILDALKDPTP